MHHVLVRAAVGLALRVYFGGGIDGILRSVRPEADGSDERALEVIGTVEAGLCRKGLAVLHPTRFLEVAHDFFKGQLGHFGQRLRAFLAELTSVERLPRNDS
jgi:hypothetical protein